MGGLLSSDIIDMQEEFLEKYENAKEQAAKYQELQGEFLNKLNQLIKNDETSYQTLFKEYQKQIEEKKIFSVIQLLADEKDTQVQTLYNDSLNFLCDIISKISIQAIKMHICYFCKNDSQFAYGFDAISESFIAQKLPNNFTINKYSTMQYLHENIILVCGGVDKNNQNVEDSFYLWDPPYERYFKIEKPMKTPKYAHTSFYYKGKLYIFGGRTDQGIDDLDSITAACECFDFQKREWENIDEMKVPRCSALVLLSNENIYVFGGYMGESRRKRAIERYNILLDKWQLLKVKMHKGIEAGLICPLNIPNEFLIIGGNTFTGASNNIYKYNFASQNVHNAGQLTEQRAMQKGFFYQNEEKYKFYMWGGNQKDECVLILDIGKAFEKEKEQSPQFKTVNFDCLKDKFQKIVVQEKKEKNLEKQISQPEQEIQIKEVINLKTQYQLEPGYQQMSSEQEILNSNDILIRTQTDQNDVNKKTQNQINDFNNQKQSIDISISEIENMTMAYQPLIIQTGKNLRYVAPEQQIPNNVYLFGTDLEPFILEFNLTTKTVINKPVPLGIRLSSFQGGVQISKNEFLLIGGIRDAIGKIENHCYIYDVKTETGKTGIKLRVASYAFPSLVYDEKVFIFGGRSTSGGEIEGILQRCQQYDIKEQSWKLIADLNIQRCSCQASVINDCIFVWGGYSGDSLRPLEIEKYDEEHDEWHFIEFQMQIPLEMTASVTYQNEIITFGGHSFELVGNFCQIVIEQPEMDLQTKLKKIMRNNKISEICEQYSDKIKELFEKCGINLDNIKVPGIPDQFNIIEEYGDIANEIMDQQNEEREVEVEEINGQMELLIIKNEKDQIILTQQKKQIALQCEKKDQIHVYNPQEIEEKNRKLEEKEEIKQDKDDKQNETIQFNSNNDKIEDINQITGDNQDKEKWETEAIIPRAGIKSYPFFNKKSQPESEQELVLIFGGMTLNENDSFEVQLYNRQEKKFIDINNNQEYKEIINKINKELKKLQEKYMLSYQLLYSRYEAIENLEKRIQEKLLKAKEEEKNNLQKEKIKKENLQIDQKQKGQEQQGKVENQKIEQLQKQNGNQKESYQDKNRNPEKTEFKDINSNKN